MSEKNPGEVPDGRPAPTTIRLPLTGKQLRAAILSKQPEFRQQDFTFELGGETFSVKIREPSTDDRSEMFRRAGLKGAEVNDAGKLQVWATILCTYAEGGDRVFSEDSADALLQMPSKGFVSKISDIVMEMISAAETKGKT